jgi:hypothetical protein
MHVRRALVVPSLLLGAFLALAAAPLAAQAPQAAKRVASADTSAVRPGGAGCVAPSHTAMSKDLIVTVNAENTVKQSTDAMIDAQLRANPMMAQYVGDLLREYLAEQMRWQDLEPEFVRLYCEMFTEAELKEMIAFNRTPLGQKIIRVTPELMRRAMSVGETRVQANMPAFQKRIEERVAKLKAEGKIPE